MKFGVRELLFLFVLLAMPIASFVYVFKPRNDDIRQAKHEIEVKQIHSDVFEGLDLVAETAGIGAHEGWRDEDTVRGRRPGVGAGFS